MREASKWMDFSWPTSFSLEDLILFSLDLIWTYGSLVISPARYRNPNRPQVKLIYIHIQLSHPVDWSPCAGLWVYGNILHMSITLFHSVSQLPFPLKSPEWFHLMMKLSTSKNRFTQDRNSNLSLMLVPCWRTPWKTLGKWWTESKQFMSIHKSQTNLSLKKLFICISFFFTCGVSMYFAW